MRSLVAALLLTTAPITAQAAEIAVQGDVLTFRGPITIGDGVRFHINLMAADSAGRPVRSVRLNSPGGLVGEAEQIARDVKQRGLDTTVVANGMCASACFLPFAAGKAKVVEDYAMVGVHNASTAPGQDSEAGTLQMSLFAKGLGVPGRILERMAAQTSDEMGWLSGAELQTMNVTVGRLTPRTAWTGSEKYDEKASAKLKNLQAEDMSDAIAHFKASPLYSAITGEQ